MGTLHRRAMRRGAVQLPHIYLLMLLLCASAHGQLADVSNVVRSLGLQPGCSWTISLLILGLITLPIARLATYTQAAQAQLQAEDKPLILSDRDRDELEPAELISVRGSVWCATCGHQNNKRASACSLCRDNLRSEVSWDCAESEATRLAFRLLNEPITEVEPGMRVFKSEKTRQNWLNLELAQPARITTITPAMTTASERISRCDTNHATVKPAAPITRSYSNLCADKAGVPIEVTKAVRTKFEVRKPSLLFVAKKCGHPLLGNSLPAAAAV